MLYTIFDYIMLAALLPCFLSLPPLFLCKSYFGVPHACVFRTINSLLSATKKGCTRVVHPLKTWRSSTLFKYNFIC